MKILFTAFALALSFFSQNYSYGALCSRTLSFSDGSVLTASQLNDELNTAFSCINNIDNSNISASANISPSKIQSNIAGDGISRDPGTGILEVNDDNSSLEISSDVLRIKDSGVTTAKIADSNVTTSKIADSNVTTIKIADSNVTTAKIADANVTTIKIADGNVTRPKLVSVGQQTATITSDIQTTTSTSFIDVAGLSVSLTTTGRPVLIFLNGYVGSVGSGGALLGANGLTVRILRDATVVCTYEYFGLGVPSSAVSCLDTPSSGTYTYKLQMKTFGLSGGVRESRIIAYEL